MTVTIGLSFRIGIQSVVVLGGIIRTCKSVKHIFIKT